MMEFFLQLKNQVVDLWQRMTRVQKIIVGLSAVVLFATLIFLGRGATAPDYATLYTLSQGDAAQVKTALDEKKIPYKLIENPDGGVTVQVPSKDIINTRLDLAVDNLPTGDVVGFESLDVTKFGETDADRRARYLRALQGELTRTIEGMPEVQKARVHIVQPEPSLFLEQNNDATAAIMLNLKPNKSLEPGQVKGIIKLVANSVEGLTPENVTVLDATGNVLSEAVAAAENPSPSTLTVTQIELQKQYQNELQTSVQSMLETVVGHGKAVVRVKLDLDFDKLSRKSTDYGETSPRSSSTTEKNSESSTGGGVPGTDTNVPPGYPTVTETGTTTSTESTEIVNNEVDTIEEVMEKAPGSIKRMSVAVVIDKAIAGQEQQTIENIVKSAAGYDESRGDQLSVAGIPFNTEYQDEMNKLMADTAKKDVYTYGGIGAAAVLALIILAVVALRKRRPVEEEIPEQAQVPAFFVAQEDEDEGLPERELTPAERDLKRIKNRIEQVAKEQTEDFAQLIKTWLAQE